MSEKTTAVLKTQGIAAVREVVADDETVIAACLFGSVAQAKAHALSDVDVAVPLVDAPGPEERFRRIIDIGSALE